ncbi:MAG: hypothetical protein WAU86_12580 [Oricola sp.]
MGFLTSAGATAMALVVAIPASMTAGAAPLPADAIRTMEHAPVLKVGHRHHAHDRYHGGISYVGPFGLKYAPNDWYRRHRGSDITVNIHIGPRERDAYRQRARPLIIELRK